MGELKMSTYCKEKVLRFPMDGDLEDFEESHSAFFDYCTPGMFQIAPTCESYIDLVLSYEYDCDGEYGKTRALTANERKKYEPIWQQIIPDIDMERVRLVEFCWYNSTEAPNYYDDVNDPFYTDEV